MSRISELMATRGKRKLLVPFFTAGYPNARTTLDLVRCGLDAGADMIELGMPFSDPMADGPEIQLSSQVALQNGTTMADTFRAAATVRRTCEAPIILMGYYNPVFAYGAEKFARAAARSGVDGLIIPDLPFDEADDLRRSAARNDLSTIFLVAPTSSDTRVALIDRACTDFVYAVTVTGVTGGSSRFDRSTDRYLNSLKKRLHKPFVAGFGVSSPESAQRLARCADGVVIGSALIRILRTAKNRRTGVRAVARLLGRLRRALE